MAETQVRILNEIDISIAECLPSLKGLDLEFPRYPALKRRAKIFRPIRG